MKSARRLTETSGIKPLTHPSYSTEPTHKAGEAALADWFASGAARFETDLAALLHSGNRRPERLMAAMRHGTLAGGKRLRPYLVLNSARLCGQPEGWARIIAMALECIHCYSLVHDDLPAMDNDDMRRGRPTVHRAFDEATAILAGDGLLTMAFSLLASADAPGDPATRLHIIAALADAAGIDGMVGGQMLDLAAEGRFADLAEPLDLAAVSRLQALKTGALIRFAAMAGGRMPGGRQPDHLAALDRYGTALGLAFQIRDDLIDVEVDSATAGKATGKDDDAGKGTFVSLLGLDGARARLEAVTHEGLSALAPFGAAAGPLAAALTFNQTRRA